MKSLENVVKALHDKKGESITAYDVSATSDLWDFFVLCSGTSSTHIRTLYENVEKELIKDGEEIPHKDTGSESDWVVVDTGDILVHVFNKDTREYYGLEKLWGENEVETLKWQKG